ncbi:MAG: helix-turn-helix domain-containing protein [Rhizomicrobium sp.]|jgi:excisionase family DNA binding protein
MSQELYSVEQVAAHLGLHVRTVRNYVREGRLKAVRIGKQYRIARDAIEALTGHPLEALTREAVRRHRHIDVSSIVEIDAIDPDSVSRVTNLLMGAANGRRADDEPLRVETVHDPERARLKIIIVGGLDASAGLLKVVGAIVEAA